MKNNLNPLYEMFDGSGDAATYAGAHAATGIGALALRYIKLKKAKEIILKAYPTPESLQKKLEPIMDRNPAARKLYTKLDGMSQSKYVFWVKYKMLRSYSIKSILGNYILGPIGMVYQGADIANNAYFKTAGDYVNDLINREEQMDRMYYTKAK